jgi:hypothetical protein
MSEVEDISKTEMWLIETTLKERYDKDNPPAIELGDAEIRLYPSDRELTACPLVHWQFEGCHFVVFKTGDNRYRAQFFYRSYGTGVREYNDLSECLVSLLQVQADHQAQESGDIKKTRR